MYVSKQGWIWNYIQIVVNMQSYQKYSLNQKMDMMFLWVIKNPMTLIVKSMGVTPVSWPNSLYWPLSIMASQ